MKITSVLVTAGLLLGIVAAPAMVPQTVTAAADPNAKAQLCNGIGGCTNDNGAGFNSLIKTIVNILLLIIGAASVIMIVIGGMRYTLSNGDSSAVKGAKDTILYAIIGLIVASAAYAIVNWVIIKL